LKKIQKRMKKVTEKLLRPVHLQTWMLGFPEMAWRLLRYPLTLPNKRKKCESKIGRMAYIEQKFMPHLFQF
jgi:hypothetical protein